MQLLPGAGGCHIKQALSLIVFPPALKFTDPRIDAALFSIAADGSNHELALLLLRRANQPGLFQPAKQRLRFRPGCASQARHNHNFKAEPLCFMDGHQLHPAAFVRSGIGLGTKFGDLFFEPIGSPGQAARAWQRRHAHLRSPRGLRMLVLPGLPRYVPPIAPGRPGDASRAAHLRAPKARALLVLVRPH